MVKATEKPSVFLVSGAETYDGRYKVAFGRDFNKPSNTKSFRTRKEAVIFARRKARMQGNKEIDESRPGGGAGVIKVDNRNIKRRVAEKRRIVRGIRGRGILGTI